MDVGIQATIFLLLGRAATLLSDSKMYRLVAHRNTHVLSLFHRASPALLIFYGCVDTPVEVHGSDSHHSRSIILLGHGLRRRSESRMRHYA